VYRVQVADFGVFVKWNPGRRCFVRSNELFVRKSIFSDNDKRDPKAVEINPYKEGDAVQGRWSLSSKKRKKKLIAIRRYEQDSERELLKKYSGQTGNPTLVKPQAGQTIPNQPKVKT